MAHRKRLAYTSTASTNGIIFRKRHILNTFHCSTGPKMTVWVFCFLAAPNKHENAYLYVTMFITHSNVINRRDNYEIPSIFALRNYFKVQNKLSCSLLRIQANQALQQWKLQAITAAQKQKTVFVLPIKCKSQILNCGCRNTLFKVLQLSLLIIF